MINYTAIALVEYLALTYQSVQSVLIQGPLTLWVCASAPSGAPGMPLAGCQPHSERIWLIQDVVPHAMCCDSLTTRVTAHCIRQDLLNEPDSFNMGLAASHPTLLDQPSNAGCALKQLFAKCPFTHQFNWLSNQFCHSIDRVSDDHFAKHCLRLMRPSAG